MLFRSEISVTEIDLTLLTDEQRQDIRDQIAIIREDQQSTMEQTRERTRERAGEMGDAAGSAADGGGVGGRP